MEPPSRFRASHDLTAIKSFRGDLNSTMRKSPVAEGLVEYESENEPEVER